MGLWSCAVYEWVDHQLTVIAFANSEMESRAPCDNVAILLAAIMFGDEVPVAPQTLNEVAAPERIIGPYALDDGGRVEVSVNDGRLLLRPSGQNAMVAVFPTDMAAMLPKYNGLTKQLVEAMAAGDFDNAGSYMNPNLGGDPVAILSGFWAELSDSATLTGIDVSGTRMGRDAETFCKVRLSNGSAAGLMVSWMMGRCVGLQTTDGPTRTFLPETETKFATYSLYEGVTRVEFDPKGGIRIDTPEGPKRGHRS
jgi:hypothetical protein